MPNGEGSWVEPSTTGSVSSQLIREAAGDSPAAVDERAGQELIPLEWIDLALGKRLEKMRGEVERVQMKLETHESWAVVWESVNAMISDLREMKRTARDVSRVLNGGAAPQRFGAERPVWAQKAVQRAFDRRG